MNSRSTRTRRARVAAKLRDLERRLRDLEKDQRVERVADAEVLELGEKALGAVSELVSGLYFYGSSARPSKLEGYMRAALRAIAPAIAELEAEQGPAAAHKAIFGEDG